MKRMIDLDAALDALTDYCENKCVIREDAWCPDCQYEAFKDVLKALPSAQAEQRWIPCKERPPEANGRYLVTRGLDACGAMWNRVYLINYSDLMGLKSERIWWCGNVGKSDFQKINDVIAWCESPESYKEGHDDQKN